MHLISIDGTGKVPQDGPMQTVCRTSRCQKATNVVRLCWPQSDLLPKATRSILYTCGFLWLDSAHLLWGENMTTSTPHLISFPLLTDKLSSLAMPFSRQSWTQYKERKIYLPSYLSSPLLSTAMYGFCWSKGKWKLYQINSITQKNTFSSDMKHSFSTHILFILRLLGVDKHC